MLSRRSRIRVLRHATWLAIFALALASTSAWAGVQQVSTCFVPEYHGGTRCTDEIVSAIGNAQKSILVQAYGFTSAPIAKALVAAHTRGVQVCVILDKSNVKQGYSSAKFLENMGIPTLVDSEHSIAHNKVMVIDDRRVITGSFNFTTSAEERNAENIVFIDDPAIAAAYTRNWQDHASHSKPVQAEASSGGPTRLASNAEPIASTQASDGAVIGNRKSKIYEWPGCPAYDKIGEGNRVLFRSHQAAEAEGYRAARNCP
jgi:phosphatidylserine/phosphatidylglycerophosphate/cardiolipin synthase-like enzyme